MTQTESTARTGFVSHLEAALDGTRLPARTVQTTHEGRPLVVIDLAIPRDFAPDSGAIDGVHVSNILAKLGVRTRVEAAAIYTQEALRLQSIPAAITTEERA